MPSEDLELQLDWDARKLDDRWPRGRDTAYMMARLSCVPAETTARDASGRVLEVAAGDAVDSCRLNLQGLESVALEPSPVMLQRARARMAEYDAHVTLVRGIAETLPFADRTFDRVLCNSAIDHLADPELGIREMTRVLKPNGRLIIGVVNYGSLSVRLSRAIYRVGRGLRLIPRDVHLIWDTPVPIEHTFECTYAILSQLCRPYLTLERAFGVSIGWMCPGWGSLLDKLPRVAAMGTLRSLDHLAFHTPRVADYIVSVWRPRVADESTARRTVAGGGEQEDDRARRPAFRVKPTDPVYRNRVRAEAEYWAWSEFGGGFFDLLRSGQRMANAAYTGDPDRSWLDDLMARGPFADAAMLGCDEGGYERVWVEARVSERLDVYELSPGVIEKVRTGLGTLGGRGAALQRRVRFIEADLNFARLPAERYDVIWSSGCLHHIVNLEHLFFEVERALRAGGLFALHEYVGERRLRYSARRLERMNEVLRGVPVRFRRGGVEAVVPPPVEELSPFCAVRSDEILALARDRFDLVHQGLTGALFPLQMLLDLPAIAREAPEILDRFQRAEAEALREPGFGACGAYAVFRKRG